MIKFFRKIRQNLLSEGKTRKYLQYAIGEIVLVMIGILLALQVNNWNQKRIDQNKEDTILKALKTEFEENSMRYHETIKEQEKVLQLCHSLVECLERKDLNFKRDSIGFYISKGALNYFRAEPLMGTYQSLYSSGDINLIQNELLKSLLASFSSEIIQGFEDETASMDLLNLLTQEFSASLEPLYSNSERRRFGFKQPQNLDVEYQNNVLSDIYQNPNILSPLTRRMIFENNRLELQKKMLALSSEILNLINTELE